MYVWSVSIQANGKPPYPRVYRVEAASLHTALARAAKLFRKDTKGKQNSEYQIRAMRLRKAGTNDKPPKATFADPMFATFPKRKPIPPSQAELASVRGMLERA